MISYSTNTNIYRRKYTHTHIQTRSHTHTRITIIIHSHRQQHWLNGEFSSFSLLYSRFGIAFCFFSITKIWEGCWTIVSTIVWYRFHIGDNNQWYMLCYLFFLLFFFSSTIVRKKHDSSERPIDTYTYILWYSYSYSFCSMHGNHVMLLRFNLFDFNTQQDHHHHQYNNITNFYAQSLPLILLTYI